ncbi:NlpC/P60 family protein [Blautia hominis]|uniref:NlpC/P60 family protein n=1 Tax=Blautia hominis TaxID=2025493 RepID=UPI0036F39CC8
MQGVKLCGQGGGEQEQFCQAEPGSPGPGSIVFYGKDQMPEHVAISLGDGKVVHASNAREGVKISPLRYREICKVIDIPYQIR